MIPLAPLTAGWQRFAVVSLIVFLSLQLYVVHCVDFFFSNDGPQHLLTSVVHADYHDPKMLWDYTWFLNEPLTDHGYREIFTLFYQLFDWQTAHRLAVDIPGLVSTTGWFCVCWRFRPDNLIFAGPFSILMFGYTYWLGLLPFSYSMCLLPVLFFFFLRSRLQSSVDKVVFLGVLVVQVQCHPLAPALVGGLLLTAALIAREGRLMLRLLLCGAPAALLAAYIQSKGTSFGGDFEWETSASFVFFFFEELTPGFRVTQLLMTFIVLAVSLLSWRNMRGSLCFDDVLFRLAVILFLAAPFMPDNIPGWEVVAPRFSLIALPVLLVFCRLLPLHFAVRALLAFLGVTCAVQHLVATARLSVVAHDDITGVYGFLREKLPFIGPHDWDLHFISESFKEPQNRIDSYNGWAHIAQVLAIEKGGRPQFTQANDLALHGLIRPARPASQPGQLVGNKLADWAQLWTETSADTRRMKLGAHFATSVPSDVFFIVGRPTDGPLLKDVGFDVTSLGTAAPGVEIFQGIQRGCSVSLTITSPVADVLEIGVAPLAAPIDVIPIAAGETVLELQGWPCARWWLRTELGCSGQAQMSLAEVAGPTALWCANGSTEVSPPKPHDGENTQKTSPGETVHDTP